MKRFLFPLMLIVVVALVLYAPVRYNFIYPTGGDDADVYVLPSFYETFPTHSGRDSIFLRQKPKPVEN